MRLRVRFAKLGRVRFTSHRDVARIFERTVRIVGLPVAYSQGFSPRARLSFGLALATGHESHSEYLDIDLDPSRAGGVDCATVAAAMTHALPEGLTVTAVAAIDASAPSLQQIVTSCAYRIDFLVDPFGDAPSGPVDVDHALGAATRRIAAAPTLVVPRERKGRVADEDIRPGLLGLERPGPARIVVELASQPRGVRPAEFLTALHHGWDGPAVVHRVCRTHQWTTLDGRRVEPLPASTNPGDPVPAAGGSPDAACAGETKEPPDGRQPPQPRIREPLIGAGRAGDGG